MRTCETCKHWFKNKDYEDYPIRGLGICENVPMLWEATKWNDDGDRILIDKCKDKKAFAQDASDYSAYLLTRNDFGCVSHEDK